MSYYQSVPFTRKTRAPDVDAVVDRIAARYERKQRQNEEADAMLAVEITEALDKGASLRELAQRLGVSVQTIRNMKAGGLKSNGTPNRQASADGL